MSILGMRFEREGDVLVARFVPTDLHQGAPGILHGGMAAMALDEAMASVTWMLDRMRSVTATLEVRYRRPVPIDGQEIRVEAWRDHPEGRKRQRIFGKLLLPTGETAVEGKGLFLQTTSLDDGDR